MVIPQALLVVSGPFGDELSAEDVARAIGRGLVAGGQPEADLCPLEVERRAPAPADASVRAGAERDSKTQRMVLPDVAALLAALDFDARMRRARAVLLAEWRLTEGTLQGSTAFEVATRARQGGIPAYAVTGENALTPFDSRILDLQVILEAHTRHTLAAAGTKLARLV